MSWFTWMSAPTTSATSPFSSCARRTAWYAVETDLDNSTLLGPVDKGDYVFVNHARWDMSLPWFAIKQFSKRTFYSYVLANMHANRTAAMPILYHLA